MAKISRMEPSRPLRSRDPFDAPSEDFFRGLFLHPMSLASRAWADEAQFRVDVTENDNEFRVHAEMPGQRKEDIHVTIDGDEVAISAEAKREAQSKDKEGKTLRTERFSGRMYRAFSLGHEIDETRTEARYVDGVLELTLPKKAPEQTKRKQIQIL